MYQNKRTSFLYLFPAVLLVTLFIYVAVIMNFYYSLFRWNAYSVEKVWIGLTNYKQLFVDPNFWTAFANNIYYAVISVIFQVGLGLVLAAVLEQKWLGKFSAFSRTVFFLPSMISATVVALMWQMLLNPNLGVVNRFLEMVGLGHWAMDWLGNGKTAIFCIIAASQWQFIGYITLLFIVAIQKIPGELYEAAEIDGACGVKKFLWVTVPNVREMLLLNMTTTIIGAFKVFDMVHVMTAGGPGTSSEVMGTLMFRIGFRNDRMGYASAIGTVIFIVTFILSIIQIRLFNVDETENAGGV